MNVLFISECSKNALTETRRILDQFAERCGNRTWRTHITMQGLNTVRMMLKRTARRNSAIACHWIRGKDRTDLMWIVGNAAKFNERGATPTNRTGQDILRFKHEHDWHSLQDIQLLASLAAIFHDLGKASQGFQNKLAAKKHEADAFRHEWVSLRLFEAFVAQSLEDNEYTGDHAWLTCLKDLQIDEQATMVLRQRILHNLKKDGQTNDAPASPFKTLPPLARIIGWLMLTHHQLPLQKGKGLHDFNPRRLISLLAQLGPEWNSASDDPDPSHRASFWIFNKGLPLESTHWQRRAKSLAEMALQRNDILSQNWMGGLFAPHMARLVLMLADHHYSSLEAHPELGDEGFPLFANTDPKTGKTKQRLDEHLLGVESTAKRIAHVLPKLNLALPRITRHKGFTKRSPEEKYRWQDNAYDLACSIRERAMSNGFFGINMASTGSGKTFANGRIMYGLSKPETGARFTIALGLRTLTLQTGDAYRDRLGLGSDDLAVLVGSGAARELFSMDRNRAPDDRLHNGSESAEPLLNDNSYVHFDGISDIGPLKQWLDNTWNGNALIAAPILTCTIDHLIGATEAFKGGRQIAPMLRLLTSDLILDEPDDFDIQDLPALSRLVHWAGMLGSKVLLSSATLPPSLVEGLFQAYHAGRKEFQKERGASGRPGGVTCAWFEEHNNSATASDHFDTRSFRAAHDAFVAKRIERIKKSPIRRRAKIIPLQCDTQDKKTVRDDVASTLHGLFHSLHQEHHSVDPITGKKVSFGLIRFANIDPLIDVALTLFKTDAKENHHISFCCYHARHPLIVRSAIESTLDRLLNRHEPENVFNDLLLREILNDTTDENVIIAVLATPVAEVGRDHDYDWAIVEPSSMRSIIQLAGRVMRHRQQPCNSPNIILLGTNIRSLEHRDGAATYRWPGFEESPRFTLSSHDLASLITPEQYEEISAAPRIAEKVTLAPQDNLADLEHARIHELMLGEFERTGYSVSLWWNTQAAFSAEWQRVTPFRYDPLGRQRFGLLLDEHEESDTPAFYDLEGELPKKNDGSFQRLHIEKGRNINALISLDYATMVDSVANRLSIDRSTCTRRFGWIELPARGAERGWNYHHVLGIQRVQS